jgi:hypothetical protein
MCTLHIHETTLVVLIAAATVSAKDDGTAPKLLTTDKEDQPAAEKFVDVDGAVVDELSLAEEDLESEDDEDDIKHEKGERPGEQYTWKDDY